MKTVGIICEYNPLHLGHAAQMETIRRICGADTAIVCVMSGNFVQRGEPAVLDKYTRAAAAVLCGADLVVELPVTAALSSAEGFARGGVEVLDRMGVADLLCFGSETGDAETLSAAARAMEDPSFAIRLREKLADGLSYGAAKQRTLEALTGLPAVARTPNDILAVEYCRALHLRQSAMEPLPILRPGSYHAAVPDQENPSATAVRSLMDGEEWLRYVPIKARELFRAAPRYFLSAGERAILARLRAMSAEEWKTAAHGSEGLWSKAMKAVRSEATLAAVVEKTLSKRYPRTRIMRLLTCAYLGIREETLAAPVTSVRVLALSQKGTGILKRARDRGSLQLLNPGQHAADAVFEERERRVSDLYALFSSGEMGLAPAQEKKARISFGEK